MLMSVESEYLTFAGSSTSKYLLIAYNNLAMQLPEDGTCINRLIKNEFFVLFIKLLNCKSLFPKK